MTPFQLLGRFAVDCDCGAFGAIETTNACGAAVGWAIHRVVTGHSATVEFAGWRP